MTSQEAVLLIDISLTNEEALNVVETYAQIQIEKDRERVKAEILPYLNLEDVEHINYRIDNSLIILD